MSTLEDFKKSLIEFSQNFRNPKQPDLTVSDLYDLFPVKEDSFSWPSDWTNYDKAGVYAMLDDKLNIRYIGKASMGNTIGNRLSSYFKYTNYRTDKRCQLKHPDSWAIQPRYVVTIPVSPDCSFEAPSIEEYLILKLLPEENLQGRPRSEKID